MTDIFRLAARRPAAARALDALRRNRPLAAAIADGVLAAAARPDTKMVAGDVPRVVAQVQEAMASSPVVQSQVSAEPWWQNRVKVGAALIALGLIGNRLGINLGLDAEAVNDWTLIVATFGGAVVAVGEFLSRWLAGIDWRRPWTLFGIGR